MSFCRFGGHEDKIMTREPEGKYGETKVWSDLLPDVGPRRGALSSIFQLRQAVCHEPIC